jgi:hypothetical protein
MGRKNQITGSQGENLGAIQKNTGRYFVKEILSKMHNLCIISI